MIFSSPQMDRLRVKHADTPDFVLPDILLIDRHPDFADEGAYLDSLFAAAPPSKHADWLGRLLSARPGQHIGAWFEIMLFGWLQKIGAVEVEPQMEGNQPDFALLARGHTIAIEARAILKSDDERRQIELEAEVYRALQAIPRSFLVELTRLELVDRLPDVPAFQRAVTTWLDTTPDTPFCYEEPGHCRIELELDVESRIGSLKTLGVTDSIGFKRVDASPLQAPLRQKARQHKAIRKAGYPYIIALFLEPYDLSAEEVVETWLGPEVALIDTKTATIVEQYRDPQGIHFLGREIRHRTVSGTLVFSAVTAKQAQRRELRGWYIENPYATRPLPPDLFPVTNRYIVKERTAQTLIMGWESAQ